MNVCDAYQTLELEYGASLDDIDRAHRNLIRVWHPDRFIKSADLHSFAEEKAKRLNEARDILRKAWETGQLQENDGQDANPDSESDEYEDRQVSYHGDDPRIKAVVPNSQGKPAALALTRFGVILATFEKGEIDEVIAYPRQSIRWIATSTNDYLRSPETPLPIRHSDYPPTNITILADDPEELVKGLRAIFRFRNEYFAKLFVKRAVAILGLQLAQPKTPTPVKSSNEALVGCSIAAALFIALALTAIIITSSSPKKFADNWTVAQHIKFSEQHSRGVRKLLFVNQDLSGDNSQVLEADNLSNCDITFAIRYANGSVEEIKGAWPTWNRNETKEIVLTFNAKIEKVTLTGHVKNGKHLAVILHNESETGG